MVKKNKILEKNDNEIKKLSEAIKSLNNNNIFKIYNSTKKILFISFLKGLAWTRLDYRRYNISFTINLHFITDRIHTYLR